MTPKLRSKNARKAAQARWAKAKEGVAAPTLDNSEKALHLCLKRIKKTKAENEVRRLTEEFQRIVFHK
jgi:hypothetical protein